MKESELLDELMNVEAKAKAGGLSIEEIVTAYELRSSALDEEDTEDGEDD